MPMSDSVVDFGFVAKEHFFKAKTQVKCFQSALTGWLNTTNIPCHLLKEQLSHRDGSSERSHKNYRMQNFKRGKFSLVLRALFVSRQNMGGFQAFIYLEAQANGSISVTTPQKDIAEYTILIFLFRN